MSKAILVIDDEPEKFASYQEELESAGYSVKVMADPASGLEYFLGAQNDLEVVIVDLMMPPPAMLGSRLTEIGLRTGQVVFERIREENPTMPVVVLTNRSLSRVDLREDRYLVLREKRETPAFALPKVVERFLSSARRSEDGSKKEREEESAHMHLTIGGDVVGPVMVSEAGSTQSVAMSAFRKDSQRVVGQLVERLREDGVSRVLRGEDWERLEARLAELESVVAKAEGKSSEVAEWVEALIAEAPWAKRSVRDFLREVGAGGVGSALAEGIKMGLLGIT